MATVNVPIEENVHIELKETQTPVVYEQEQPNVEVQISESPSVVVETLQPKITIILSDDEAQAAIDANAAAKEARRAADEARKGAALATEQAAYAKEMGDLVKEFIGGNAFHEITEEEARQLIEEVNNGAE